MRNFFWVLAVFLFFTGPARAEDAPSGDSDTNFQYSTVTTKEGLTYRVPEDMPIETRGGIQAPIPFDEYMYGKFRKLEDRLKGIEAQLDRVEKLLLSLKDEKSGNSALTSR
ncbi:MAG TPA: hypothetical protein VL404_08270 [Candidatus Eisenbacteria bacterium]|nr:hypothetical protein [Candidatus Eisenbacteria bacterium]